MRPRSGERRSRKKRTIYPPHANQEMRRYDRTTLPADPDDTPKKSASQTMRPTRRPDVSARLPVYSIRRPLNLRTPDADVWEDYLDDVAERNRDTGKTLSLGELAVEYVSPGSFLSMMAEKHSDKFSEPQRARRIMREFAKGFNQHMREMTKQASDASFEVAHGPLHPESKMLSVGSDLVLLHESDTLLADTSLEDFYDEQDMAEEEIVDWGHGNFKVGVIRKCGELAFGFDLSDHEQFDREFNGIRSYLRSEGLNTNLMTGDRPGAAHVFMPVMPFFVQDTSGGILRYAEAPMSVPLHPPAAKEIS